MIRIQIIPIMLVRAFFRCVIKVIDVLKIFITNRKRINAGNIKDKVYYYINQSFDCSSLNPEKYLISPDNKKCEAQMKVKDIALVGILLATGAILRYFLAMLNIPLTPNIIIAFYCLAIIIVRPNIYEALAIGIVAGVLSMLISGSVFPPANLISEPVGAYVCFSFYAVLKDRVNLAPMITAFITTLASGFTFAGIATIFAGEEILAQYGGNFQEFVIAYVPIVVITAALNAIIVGVLYIPANRFLERGEE